MKLTHKNYFNPKRKHISNSQISDYIKSPAYYKAKHIDKVIPRKVTDPMKRGSIVDAILTQDANPYLPKVLKKDDPELFSALKDHDPDFIVSQSVFEQASQIADYIHKQDFWQDGLDNAMFQVLLDGEIDGVPVCGLADRIDPLGGTRYRMIDLKCVNPIKIDSPRKWLNNALDMGYVRQAAFYRHLWAKQQGIPESHVQFYHVVGAYEDVALTKVALYHIQDIQMDHAFEEIQWVLKRIQEGKFDNPILNWSNVEEL